MARPVKKGLDYFSLDCNLDDKVNYVEAKHGLIGYAVLVKLWAKIYKSEGYFCEWKEKNIYLFCKEISVELTIVNDVVNTCFEEGLFSKAMYSKFSILTSRGIQKRWQKIVTDAKRKDVVIDKKISLLEFTTEETELITEETIINSVVTTEESTQSKVKESKEENNTSIEFDLFWSSYNKKEGSKSKAKSYWDKLKAKDKEAIMTGIKVYEQSFKDKQFQPLPTTFLNGRYWDAESYGIENKKPINNTSYPSGALQNGRLAGMVM